MKDALTHQRFDMNYPKKLISTFILFSLASMIAIFLLINFGMYKIFEQHSVQEAEKSAISIGATLFEQEKENLLTRDISGGWTLSVSEQYFETLDRRMRKYLDTFNVVKIKIFSNDGVIVYSTDHSIIGKSDANNEKLQRALKGGVVSKLEKKEAVWDLAGEQRFRVDVVETYMPVKTGDQTIAGGFEVYLDISSYRNAAGKFIKSSLLITAIIMVVVLGFLLVLMLQGAGRLRKAHEYMGALATTDGLTELFNRRFLLVRANEELARVQRLGYKPPAPSTGFIMMDIDYFKKINDTHGHLVGDEILKQLALRIKGSTRKYDVVGRYGGEEFLVILPNSNLEGVRGAAEHIWKVVREKPFEAGGKSISVTVSIGVSCLTPDDKGIDDVLKRADDGLYKAKAEGRDRIAWVS